MGLFQLEIGRMQGLGFGELLRRLGQTTRERIRSGEFSERGLAKIAGISQSHLHNVLKGARSLTPQLADQLLKALGLSIGALIDGPAT